MLTPTLGPGSVVPGSRTEIADVGSPGTALGRVSEWDDAAKPFLIALSLEKPSHESMVWSTPQQDTSQ
jgi:hypothetical protein